MNPRRSPTTLDGSARISLPFGRLTQLGYPFACIKRGSWVPLLCLAAATVSVPAMAQPRPGGPEPATQSRLTEDQVKAQHHFQRAKELYLAGSYREAITELDVARKLDPKAKDLVMNLGIVHEKLGKFDEAVGYFKSYLEMEGVTPQERAKAEGFIKRIEGAKREVRTQPSATPPAESTTSAPTSPPPPPAEPEAPPQHGRIDALTIAAGSVAAVGVAGGVGLGIHAMSLRPTEFVTGRDGSYARLQEKTENAHTLAIVADVSVGLGIVAAAVTGWLYFGRTKDPTSAPATATARVSAGPISSGGVVFVGGSF